MRKGKSNGAGKTHWLRNTLIVLIACGIAGLAIAGIRFSQNPERTYASATLQFSFDGAGEGKAPNGYPFSVSGIQTDEVLNAALEAAALNGTYTAEQIRENLTVTGVYPESIVNRMTAYTSPLDKDADMQAALTDYYPTQYSVRLFSDFDPKIPSGQLTNLLNRILEAYRAYFAKTGGPNLAGSTELQVLGDYDYVQQLQLLSDISARQAAYAQEMADRAPDFQMNRKGFGEIVVSYKNLDSDINRLNAVIIPNSVSKDIGRLKTQYESQIRTLKLEQESLQTELKQIGELVASYDKDSIVYVSTSGALQKVAGNAGDTYDKLVSRSKELTDRGTQINADIARYEALLADMNRSNTTAASAKAAQGTEQADGQTGEGQEEVSTSIQISETELKRLTETTEKQLASLVTKVKKADSDFSAMLDAYTAREINERTVSVSALKYKAPSMLSGAFAVQLIKTAGPLCAVGFMICLVLIIISRRKEEKAR